MNKKPSRWDFIIRDIPFAVWQEVMPRWEAMSDAERMALGFEGEYLREPISTGSSAQVLSLAAYRHQRSRQ